MGMMNALVKGKQKSAKQNSILFGVPAAKLKNAEGNADSNENQYPAFTKLATGTRAPPQKKILSKNESRFYTFT